MARLDQQETQAHKEKLVQKEERVDLATKGHLEHLVLKEYTENLVYQVKMVKMVNQAKMDQGE
jgi:hypothetical protein